MSCKLRAMIGDKRRHLLAEVVSFTDIQDENIHGEWHADKLDLSTFTKEQMAVLVNMVEKAYLRGRLDEREDNYALPNQ